MPDPSSRAAVDRASPLSPEHNTRGALSQLVEVLLDKGVYLDLDLVITVAEVPLIAVDLRATIAGVETMLAYGLPGSWSTGTAATGEPPERREAGEVRSAAWYRESRAGDAVWREGLLVLTPAGDLSWQGTGDRRASLRLRPGELRELRPAPGSSPAGDPVLELTWSGGSAQLAGADADRWLALARRGSQDEAGGEGET